MSGARVEAVCAGCGAEGSIYREVEATYDAWRDCTVTFNAEGRIDVDEGLTERGDLMDEDPGGYACSECRHTALNIEDMVKTAEAPAASDFCCCGHSGIDHPTQKSYDTTRFTRGRRACTEPGCGCWEFETDPALATVVREAA